MIQKWLDNVWEMIVYTAWMKICMVTIWVSKTCVCFFSLEKCLQIIYLLYASNDINYLLKIEVTFSSQNRYLYPMHLTYPNLLNNDHYHSLWPPPPPAPFSIFIGYTDLIKNHIGNKVQELLGNLYVYKTPFQYIYIVLMLSVFTHISDRNPDKAA